MPDHFEETAPQATAATDGQIVQTPTGMVIAALTRDSEVILAQMTNQGGIQIHDVLGQVMLANILIALEKMNTQLEVITDACFSDEDVTL